MKSNSSRGRPIANDSSVQVDKKINDAAYCWLVAQKVTQK
jgi:hypothetical protein